MLSNSMIKNILIFLNRVPTTGFQECEAMVGIKNELAKMLELNDDKEANNQRLTE
ncbi:hypothetical protein [Paenibacillus tuaregi]|uniref:hypothetical protein n=1 Tax=Paenibacillus tuaregi TaxID=1816681 RepID=UPI000ABC31AF|nr:hypothetical protein [Paenibacillus tuaregi]